MSSRQTLRLLQRNLRETRPSKDKRNQMGSLDISRHRKYHILICAQGMRAARAIVRHGYSRLNWWITCLLVIGALSWAQDGKQSTQKQANPPAPNPSSSQTPSSPQTPSPSLPPLQLDGNAALHHLNQVVNWYRHVTTGVHDTGLPSDAIYENDAKSLGAQVAQLAFESAKAESAIIAAQQKSGGNQPPETTKQQNLEQLKAKTTGKIDDLQSQIEAINTQ